MRSHPKLLSLMLIVVALNAVAVAIPEAQVCTIYGYSYQCAAPAAPTNLVASAASSSQIYLRWTDNAANEYGYTVERSTDGTTFGVLTSSLGPNTTSYADTGLSASATYYYRVKATNWAGSSPYSNTAKATTQGAPATSSACPAGSQDVTQGPYAVNPNGADTDDYSSLQAQIDALPAGSTTTLCFPAGTYDLATPLWIEGKVVNLQGLRGATLRRYADGASHGLLKFMKDTGGSVTGFTIDGQSSYITPSADNRQHSMIILYSTDNFSVSNNTFQNVMGDGVMYYYAADDTSRHCSNYGNVENNTFVNHNEGREAIFFVCGGNLTAENNHIYNWSYPTEPGGIDVEPDYQQDYLHDILVTGNYIDNRNSSTYMWAGISSSMYWYSSRSDRVTFSYNEVTGYFRDGILMDPTPPDTITADHNYIHDINGPSGYDIDAFYNYAGDNTYSNNTVSNINNGTGYCIYRYHTATLTLSNNTFSGCK